MTGSIDKSGRLHRFIFYALRPIQQFSGTSGRFLSSWIDRDCALESTKSVSTFRTGSYARDAVVTLRNLFLGFIACLNLPIPHE